jgi:DNA-binding FrmR family transcriptional regulator
MINDDRYCDDVLVQVASATNALKSFGNEMLRSHMKSCMIDEISKGNTEVVDEIITLIGKLK